MHDGIIFGLLVPPIAPVQPDGHIPVGTGPMVAGRWSNADRQSTLAQTWHIQGTELTTEIHMTIGQNYRRATLSNPNIGMLSI
jgi:hypothetical protein